MEVHFLDPGALERTARLMCKARQILAYGGLDGIVRRPLYCGEDDVFPQFAERAQGYELFDTMGKSYVDWVNGWGPVLLGYRRPEVEEAIKSQLAAGPTLSLMHPIEVEVASILTEMIPCAEMVAFGKNGSDVLTAAVRVSRTVTKRQVILQHGMHGFHDWYMCLHPQVRGIPEVLRSLVHSFPYNDLDSLEALLERFEGNVAAVVMEPVRHILPSSGYLERVREITKKNGALLVFDEIVTAFRLANGGAQEVYGVVPDLACIGKSMANGMPLSALVGKKEYMQHLPSVGFGMTFRGETLSLAAARAVLRILLEVPVAQHLSRIGHDIREEFARACKKARIRCALHGPPSRLSFVFQDAGELSREALRDLFLQECLKQGVFTNGHLLPSYAHDCTALKRTKRGFETALRVVAEAIHGKHPAVINPVGGSPYGPRAMISTGFLDTVREEKEGLFVSGWILLEDRAPDSVEFVSAEGAVCQARAINRPDIQKVFPNIPGAENSGYAASLPAALFGPAGEYDFTLCALVNGRVEFRCRVLCTPRFAPLTGESGFFWTGDGIIYI